MKRIFVYVILLLTGIGIFFLSFNCFYERNTQLSIKVLFINQVRGGECCQKGSYEIFKRQLEKAKKYSIPTTFVFRYDALSDNKIIYLAKQYSAPYINYGIFFEVTPLLAHNADVAYSGNESNWHRPEHALLVGYSQEERKRLIDTAMNLFDKIFGFHPKTTAGWMIDTYSVTYLNEAYGVTSHQITKEQWGTDGYALYGGPVASAYHPSRKWVFKPALNKEDMLPFVMLRQTISDPVRNYGDLTSGYTSQPNDFGRTKNFGYFKHIFNQTEGYSQPLAILGLENSQDKIYEDLYERQIDYILSVVDKKNIILPSTIGTIPNNSFVWGKDYEEPQYKAYWIQTPAYRARLIIRNEKVLLTDLRLYDDSQNDPYYDSKVSDKTAFWDIPYVFDSSRNYIRKELTFIEKVIGYIQNILGNEDWLKERLNPVINEFYAEEINGIEFPDTKTKTSVIKPFFNKGNIQMDYISKKNTKVTFQFKKDTILVSGIAKNEILFKKSMGTQAQINSKYTNNSVVLSPFYVKNNRMHKLAKEAVENKKISESVDINNITVIYNAPLSLIGRNPVRLVLSAKDIKQNPQKLKEIKITYKYGTFDSVKITETEGNLGELTGIYYIDIFHSKEGSYKPILSFNGKTRELKTISFIFNCKNNPMYCLSNPIQIIKYLNVKVLDIVHRR